MNVVIAMFAGLAGGAASAFAAGILVIGICRALDVADRDGGVGYAALFAGLLAGILGMIATIVVTLRWRSQSGTAMFAQVPMALVGIIALGAGVMLWYYYQNDHPIVNGAPPILDFELQPPPNAELPDPKRVAINLQSGEKAFAHGWWDDRHPADALAGHVQLDVRTSNRLFDLQFPGNTTYLFRLKLPASPLARRYQQWSDWQVADFVFTPESNQGQRVTPERAWRIRYLVEGMER